MSPVTTVGVAAACVVEFVSGVVAVAVAEACVLEFVSTVEPVAVAAAFVVEFVSTVGTVVVAAACVVCVVCAVATVLVEVARTVDDPGMVVVQNWTPSISILVQPLGPTEITGGELLPLQNWTPLRSMQPGDSVAEAADPAAIARTARTGVNRMMSGVWGIFFFAGRGLGNCRGEEQREFRSGGKLEIFLCSLCAGTI